MLLISASGIALSSMLSTPSRVTGSLSRTTSIGFAWPKSGLGEKISTPVTLMVWRLSNCTVAERRGEGSGLSAAVGGGGSEGALDAGGVTVLAATATGITGAVGVGDSGPLFGVADG